jgi:hypothetical protein
VGVGASDVPPLAEGCAILGQGRGLALSVTAGALGREVTVAWSRYTSESAVEVA